MATTLTGGVIILTIVLAASFAVVAAVDYEYLGCFKDSSAYPDLSGSATPMSNLTVSGCTVNCRTAGYPYAGLQGGTTCMCGDMYNQRGESTDCTTCTLLDHCGGVLANDVYYSPIPRQSGRTQAAFTLANSYINARRTCIKNGGDLTAPYSQEVVNSIVQLWSGASVPAVWIGIRRRTSTSVVYEWTDPTVQPSYQSQESSYAGYWTSGDAQVLDCVSLVISTGKWKSASCDTALPYTCYQPSSSETSTDETTGDQKAGEDKSKKNKRLALFIVLPIFLFCYGGSCILYCVHKIIKNCTKRKPQAKVPFDQMEGGHRYSDHPPKRPLSASKGRIYPMGPPPVPVTLDLPSKTMPSYIPQTGGPPNMGGGKSGPEYKPDQRPSSSSGVQISVGGGPNLLAPPPSYNDDKRAKLLENAARESRERRAKEEAEGRPPSSPFAGLKSETNGGDGDVSPRSTGSTTNLLGRTGPRDDDDDEIGRGGDNNPMSINEILKRKVQEKKGKEKTKKIVTT